MIFFGRRDARKETRLGFGGGREMDDSELEEGEAFSYHNNNHNDNDYDASMDPDIDLSYIDEKIEVVLGHFQKDFEGGVSAENLGAKFGGYGSFLPAYQRSPVWSHPKTPTKGQNCNASRSPNNSLLEGGRRSSVSSSTAPLSARVDPASTNAVLFPVAKASSSLNESVRQEVCTSSGHFAEEPVPINEPVNRKSANLPDQKMLRFRIKVGSENLSTQKNAAIYSGLGLDVSPSSSLDDSPSESEGMSHEPQDAFSESPARIVRTMTSFPLHGGLLLSPLPDHLIHLEERKKLPKNGSYQPVPTDVLESSGSLVNLSDSIMGDEKMLEEKKIKLLERKEISAESKSENNEDCRGGIDIISKKGVELDTLGCEELVSKTLKLPLLSDTYYAVGDMEKGTRPSNEYKGVVRDKNSSSLVKEEPLVPTFTEDNSWVESSKRTSAGRVEEDRKASSLDSGSLYPKKDGHCKGEKFSDLVKIDSNIPKGRKALNHMSTYPPKQKANHKASSYEWEDVKLRAVKEHSSFEGKKKIKGSQSHVDPVMVVPKESMKVGSTAPKNKKSTCVDDPTTKGEVEDLKLQNNTMKVEDRYKDFFGDMELEQEENQMGLSEMKYEEKPKDFDMVEKSTHGTNFLLKEGSNYKKIDKRSTSEAFTKAVSRVAMPGADGPISDAIAAATAPVLIEDNWVCCDKCQKWRLLPPGTNPSCLPEKWLCSMLDWLPGMNRCSISEEETTHAIRYPDPGNPGGVMAKESLGDICHPELSHQSFTSHAMPTGGKKKLGLKELPNTMYKDGTIQMSNSVKKSIQASVTNGSPDVNLSQTVSEQTVSELDSLKPSKSGDFAVEKHKHKPKEKHKALDNCSDGGGSKQSKMKGKRGPDQDSFRASKKIKTEGLPEDWLSDHGRAIEKVEPSSSNVLPTMPLGKNLPKYNDCGSSKDSKYDRKDRVRVSDKNPKDEIQVSLDNGSMDLGKRDDRNAAKKRKVKESHGTQIYSGSLPTKGHLLEDGRILAKEEFSENDYRKDKKARLSRSEGKETSSCKGNGRTDKKGRHRKNQQLGQDMGGTMSQRGLDGVHSLKRDSGCLHPSVAAASSSSKVSGSHKTKSNFHDTKGSPVESVSSSPMRLKSDKLTSARKNISEKDDSVDAGFFAPAGLRRFSDGEDDGTSDRSGTARKEKTLNAHVVPSPNIRNRHFKSGGGNCLGEETPNPSKSTTLDQYHDDKRPNENGHHANGSCPRKSGKGSSSRSKDNNWNCSSEFDKDKVTVSDSVNKQAPSYEGQPTDGKNKIEVKSGVHYDKNENKYVDKDPVEHLLIENGKRESYGGSDVRVGANCSYNATSSPKQSVLPDFEKVSERGKSSLAPSIGAQNETLAHCRQSVSGSHKGNGANILAADGDNASKVPKQIKRADQTNGILHNSSRNPMSNGHRVRDIDASPVKRDSSSQAATNALKEAKNLKHLADRLKHSGSNLESTRLYFEAALKFLHGASLLETCSGENAKAGEVFQSMQVYSSTAKLCEFCAHEYEKSKDMAAAALAYKCMEVAYMRVIYSSHTNANKDWRELQKIVPPGESPSSSASDIDNLNHPTTADKAPSARGMSSPQVTGSHIIAAKNRPNFVRLLDFAQAANFAMEASRKSRIAFATANTSLGEAQCRDGVSSIKTALDFNFQDVEGLLRLVRLAIEAISR